LRKNGQNSTRRIPVPGGRNRGKNGNCGLRVFKRNSKRPARRRT